MSVGGLSAGKIDIAWMSADPVSGLPVCPAAEPAGERIGMRRGGARTACEVLLWNVDGFRINGHAKLMYLLVHSCGSYFARR